MTAVIAVQERTRVETAVALRVTVFALIMYVALLERPWRYARLPDELRFEVPGLLPPVMHPWIVAAGTVLLVVACGFAAWGQRWAMVAVVPLAWWILAVPQMYGKVNHYHHLLWLALLFAAMPAAAALRWTWPTMGVVYLFPGLAKLAAAETLIFDDGMLRIIQSQQWTRPWDTIGSMSPLFAQVAAVGTIIFEVGFVFGSFTRLRRFWAVAGVGFHLGVFAVMGISFEVAMIVLVVLAFDRSPHHLDWQPVAAVVLAGAVMAGVVNTHGWPFAPYPPFDQAPTERTVLEVRDADGDKAEWLAWMPGARRHGLGISILRERDRIAERCEVIAPPGGSCWEVTGLITPEGVRVVDEQRVA